MDSKLKDGKEGEWVIHTASNARVQATNAFLRLRVRNMLKSRRKKLEEEKPCHPN